MKNLDQVAKYQQVTSMGLKCVFICLYVHIFIDHSEASRYFTKSNVWQLKLNADNVLHGVIYKKGMLYHMDTFINAQNTYWRSQIAIL